MGGKTVGAEPRHGKATPREGSSDALGNAVSLAGIASSAVTVLGFAQTLRSGDGLWVLSGLGTAVFFLYAAWRRHRVAMAASAMILVLAVAALGGLLAHLHVPARTAGASASAAASSAGASAASPQAGIPPVRVIQVTLPRHAAVDLDSGTQAVVLAGQIGATGGFDLYHDAGEVMSDVIRTPDGMYVYPADASPDSAYAICSDYTSANPSYNAYVPSAGVDTGDTFCFKTTGGKLAWATIEAVQPDSYTAVLQVRIWK